MDQFNIEEIRRLIVQLPIELQTKILNYNDVKLVCEFIVDCLNYEYRTSDKFGPMLAKLMHLLAINSEISLFEKAQYDYKYALICQNFLKLDEAEIALKEATKKFTILGSQTEVQIAQLVLCYNYLFQEKFAEAQNGLIKLEDSINFKPNFEELDLIRVASLFFKVINYVNVAVSSRVGYLKYTEKIYDFFRIYKPKPNWDAPLLSEYYNAIHPNVEAMIINDKIWIASVVFENIQLVLEQPNIFHVTKETAKNEQFILSNHFSILNRSITEEQIENLKEMFFHQEFSSLEQHVQKLNLSNLLCDFYHNSNNLTELLNWFKIFQEQNEIAKEYIRPEETSYITFYNKMSAYFAKYGKYELAFNNIDIITKLHNSAIHKVDSFRYEEQKLWLKLQKEEQVRFDIERKLEQTKQELLIRMNASLDTERTFNDISDTVLSFIEDIPEKKQFQIIKKMKLIQSTNRNTVKLSKFEESFSLLFPTFLTTLEKGNPKITKVEKQVCMAILTNLSNQQMADFFCKETRTIEEYLRRIRRKLNLEQRANLKLYLQLLVN